MKKVETASTRHAHRFVVKRLASLRDARRNIISWLVLIGLLVVAVVLQMVWSQNGFRTTAAIAGGTYAEGMMGPIRTLNPLYAQTSAELSASRLIYSSLYDYDETGALRSDLAESLSVDETGKVYTITLKPNIQWHDGQTVTAEDVVFTVNAMKNPDARAVMQPSWAGITAAAPNPRTVTFTLSSPLGTFPHALTFGVLPKHVLASVTPSSLRENAFSLSPIGSGPFAFRLLQTVADDESEKVVRLTRFPDYHRGIPKLERFEIHSFSTSEEIINALRERDINAALDITGAFKSVPKDNFAIRSQPVQSAVYALFNTDSAQLKDVTVRRALQRGTDTSALRSTLPYATGAFDLPVSSTQVKTAELPTTPSFDKEEAKNLLEQGGWKQEGESRSKDGQVLTLRLVAAKNTDYSRIAKALQSQWMELGIKVDVVEYDSARTNQSFAQSILQPRAYDVLLNELTIGAAADGFAYWHSSQANNGSGLNFSNFRSGLADDALLSAHLRSEQSLRDQKYKVFSEEWLSQAPAIGIYQSPLLYAQQSRISSFSSNAVMPSMTDRYANVLYWTTDQAQVYKTP